MKLHGFIGLAVGALLLVGLAGLGQITTADPAEAANCVSRCKAGHRQCLISTRNRSRCDSALQRCLDQCLSGRRGLGGPLLDWFVAPPRPRK